MTFGAIAVMKFSVSLHLKKPVQKVLIVVLAAFHTGIVR